MTRAHLVIALAAVTAFAARPAVATAEEEASPGEEQPAEAAEPAEASEDAASEPASQEAGPSEEAATPSAAAEPASAGSAEPASAAAAPSGPATGSGAEGRVSERVARIGRVETVLLENEDPESAIEFGQEALRDHGDDAELRLLLGACQMRLDRPADAAPHFEAAVTGSASGDPVLHMHALYSLGRALSGVAGREADAADAYERYVAFVRAHDELPGQADRAEAWAAALRNRAEHAAAQSTRRRGRRR